MRVRHLVLRGIRRYCEREIVELIAVVSSAGCDAYRRDFSGYTKAGGHELILILRVSRSGVKGIKRRQKVGEEGGWAVRSASLVNEAFEGILRGPELGEVGQLIAFRRGDLHVEYFIRTARVAIARGRTGSLQHNPMLTSEPVRKCRSRRGPDTMGLCVRSLSANPPGTAVRIPLCGPPGACTQTGLARPPPAAASRLPRPRPRPQVLAACSPSCSPFNVYTTSTLRLISSSIFLAPSFSMVTATSTVIAPFSLAFAPL